MKFSHALASVLSLIPSAYAYVPTYKDQFHATKDNIGQSMWLFGESGIFVYNPDGTQQKVHLKSEALCGKKEDHEGPSYKYCRFSSAMSDGKKFVWAAVNRGKPTIDVFDIDTGSVVGSFETCPNANSLEYHPLRDEVWVRCSSIDAEDETAEQTFLDVFSASNPSGDIQTNILMEERALSEGLTSNGHSVIDNTLGDVGYLTDSDLPYLYKVDLSSKKITDKLELYPAASGLDDAVYSPINKHIFIRANMCCTCGFEGADLGAECRHGGKEVTPTTGPFAGQTLEGTCGYSCRIPGIDTIGVYEFDTVSETVVGTHLMDEGLSGDPYPSPDGKYIVFLGQNGGKTIRIVEAGENGFSSRVLVDVELDFPRTGYETKSVSRDFAFMYDAEGKTRVVFPSGTDHRLAVVEIPTGTVQSSADLNIRYITMNNEEFVAGRAPHGLFRRIEWAVGTDYVWVNDSTLNYLYVVNVATGETKIMEDMDIGTLLSVQNYERTRMIELQEQMIIDMTPKGSSAIEIVAIVVGCLAIVVGLLNYMHMAKMKKDFDTQTAKGEGQSLADMKSAGGLNSVN